MVIGLWAYRGELKKAKDRITCGGSVQVVTTLADALQQIHQIAQPLLIKRDSERAPAVTVTA